tara:strand:+ start:326 stop:517 length:192 start_codon:yes stop_codon:yes gene_type:complete
MVEDYRVNIQEENKAIKEKIYERVLNDLVSIKMDMDLLSTFTQEEYDLLVDTLTKHRWEKIKQ